MRVRESTLERARRLRGSMSPPEVKLWQQLRGRQLAGLKFRRQHPMGPWILAFYCLEHRLAVEVDGWTQGEGDAPERDERRDAWLADRGVRVLRVTDGQVMRRIGDVLDAILAAAPQPGSGTGGAPPTNSASSDRPLAR